MTQVIIVYIFAKQLVALKRFYRFQLEQRVDFLMLAHLTGGADYARLKVKLGDVVG